MQESLNETRERLFTSAFEAGVLAYGQMMSPVEVGAHVYADGRHVDKRAVGWVLCGEAHPDMFEMLNRGGDVDSSSTLWRTFGGTQIFVVQQQVGAWVHRFIVPIIGPTAGIFMNGVKKDGLLSSLSTRDGKMAVIHPIPVSQELPDFSLKKFSLDTVRQEQLSKDIGAVTLLYFEPKSMPCHGEAVQHVCVTTVLSAEVLALLKASIPKT
jgi:hypothetical protein